MRNATLGVAALVLGVVVVPARASETIGGSGGGTYRVACGVGRFVVGVTGRSGDWIDQVAPICVAIDGHGHWNGSPTTGPSVGGAGGGAFTMTCPRDSVVTGFYGYAQAYVINFGLVCQHDGANGPEGWRSAPALVGGSLDVSSSAGGDCGAAHAADGIIGSAGAYVDRFGLSCAGYLVLVPAPVPAARPADKIILSPVAKKTDYGAALKGMNRDFAAPTIGGAGVDVCLHWGTSCGAPAADEFCRRQGYAAAVASSIQNDAPPTLVLGDNAVCKDPTCDRFSAITCR
jgi:hypothetical protein